MKGGGSVHARTLSGSRGVGVLVLFALVAGACELVRPSERPRPPASARESRELVREAEALVEVRGTVASHPVLGTHELSLRVVNHSRWTLTELRISVSDGDARSEEYVLRSREAVGPGESATLSTVLDVDAGYGRPPAWRYLGATGYAPALGIARPTDEVTDNLEETVGLRSPTTCLDSRSVFRIGPKRCGRRG